MNYGTAVSSHSFFIEQARKLILVGQLLKVKLFPLVILRALSDVPIFFSLWRKLQLCCVFCSIWAGSLYFCVEQLLNNRGYTILRTLPSPPHLLCIWNTLKGMSRWREKQPSCNFSSSRKKLWDLKDREKFQCHNWVIFFISYDQTIIHFLWYKPQLLNAIEKSSPYMSALLTRSY